jgi:hypothetical protein
MRPINVALYLDPSLFPAPTLLQAFDGTTRQENLARAGMKGCHLGLKAALYIGPTE